MSFLAMPKILVQRDKHDNRRGDESEYDIEVDGFTVSEQHVA